jgi:glycosyltransferase involved in cell wall biosynthesis
MIVRLSWFNPMNPSDLRVLIVAEHASARFGGEAALPLHYFRVLRDRGIETWLVVHERTQQELELLFPQDCDRLLFVPDTTAHRLLYSLGKRLPHRLSYFTVGLVMRILTQVVQRRIIRQVVRSHQIDVIHQPMPVSPKEPSMIYGMGVPVVIGPMNGGMNYPAAFQHFQSRFVSISVQMGRLFSNLLHRLLPGKLQASVLLVANDRTRQALPAGVRGRVMELVENGVDLSVWQPVGDRQLASVGAPVSNGSAAIEPISTSQPTRFVYVGRLVDWKAVDLLLLAFRQATEQVCASLEIIGDGAERTALENQAQALGLLSPLGAETSEQAGNVQFRGWLSQAECARRLQDADALVLPSLLECGGAVVLEAMSMELPVIATNWGGPKDYLDASCGILVEPDSRKAFIDGLADAMIQLATKPEVRHSMGKAGRQRILDQFNWDTKVNRILEIYQEAIATSSVPSGKF